MRFSRRSLALALPFLGGAARAQGAWSPSQPIRVIIPFTAGGAMDPVVRLAQAALQADLGQAVVMDYRPGGATVVGTQETARAPADGHTLLMVANSFAANITLRPSMPYNSLRDFAPICMATVAAHVLVVHPSVARDFAGLVAAGKRAGDGLSFGSYGIGTSNHLGGQQFVAAAGLNAIHVPYNGNAPANNDLMGNRIQFMFATKPDVLQMIQGGQMRALGISAAERAPELPDVPTMAELGYPLVLSDSWFGLLARADVPAPARARLEAAWVKALTQPEVRARLEAVGYTVLAHGAERFGTEITRYTQTYADVIRQANIRVE
jgi:tripartite-type tricarboxylate transporter receptor subunit TctC